MDYHTQQQHHFNNNNNMHGLSLPGTDSSSIATSNEKALMWSNTQYMTESGYSTQAPSISSIDAFLNNEQMDSTINNMDTNNAGAAAASSVSSTSNTVVMPNVPSSSDWHHKPEVVIQQPQIVEQQSTEAENDNAVANWMNYQDNSEMALKAIPELLKLITDEDLIVVQQAAILFNQMSRNEGPRIALIQTNNAVQCLVDCLNATTDLDTARSLVGTLYSVSTQKPAGVHAIINSKALATLVKMLNAPMETIVSYSITTLHNVLLDCGDQVKIQLRKMHIIPHMIPLLSQTSNVKFLSIVVDCLQLLAFGNQETKQQILELGGTQLLVGLLMNQHNYQKLLLNTTRLLKVLSVCSQNKQSLVGFNAMQALSMHLLQPANMQQSQTSNDILQNCLITLRNLSDAATRLNGLEGLVTNLLNLLATTSDFTVSTIAAGILSNLTCNNENNKKTALRSNGIHILLTIISKNMDLKKSTLVEPCVCALRHITNRHSEQLLAQEQVRNMNGLGIITSLMTIQPRSWSVIKAVLGVIRNFCSNQLNANHLRQNSIIEKLMQILFDAYTAINMHTQNGAMLTQVVKKDDVNLFDIVDASSAALLILAKEHHNQLIMKELDCLGFFVQMFFSPLNLIQKAAASILADLSTNKECAEVIEIQPNLNQFVQANFCNQYGQLKTIAEVTNGSNSNASIILQHVTTLMQRLQEHRTQRMALYQQQQQQQQRPPVFSASVPQVQQYPIQQQQHMDQFNMQSQQQQQQQMYYNQSMSMPVVNGFPQQAGQQQQFNQFY